MKLVFATNNIHKLEELKQLLPGGVELLSLQDIDCTDEIPEEKETLEGNASQKAWYIYNKFNVACFADDTGLEIEALNNGPGVYSARYAGAAKDPKANMKKVLNKMEKINHRNARFRTVISLIIEGKEQQFEGIVEGEILREQQGDAGFGYDPVFKPHGYGQTFAQMPMELKNSISHRGRAVARLIGHLRLLKK